jgi:hypothetical protein
MIYGVGNPSLGWDRHNNMARLNQLMGSHLPLQSNNKLLLDIYKKFREYIFVTQRLIWHMQTNTSHPQ